MTTVEMPTGAPAATVQTKLETKLPLEHEGIAAFIRWDRVGLTGGLLIVLIGNAIVAAPTVWLTLPAMFLVWFSLWWAERLLRAGQPRESVLVIMAGQWPIAITVAAVLPFFWPIMALTGLTPLLLAAPHVRGRDIKYIVGFTAFLAGVVASVGLALDDGGALPDIDDAVELPVVVGAGAAQVVFLGIVAWQNNRLQRRALRGERALNAELNLSRQQLVASRRRVARAADNERIRIERDLHDGAQQRLVALGVHLRLLESKLDSSTDTGETVTMLVAELDSAVNDLRELAHGIYPPLLEARGLPEALSAVARRSPESITIDGGDIGRFDQAVETALYFTALEALTNAAKHAPGASVHVELQDADNSVQLSVTDDGPGFDVPAELESRGMFNMFDRIAAVGGEVDVDSALGDGTRVTATVAVSERAETAAR